MNRQMTLRQSMEQAQEALRRMQAHLEALSFADSGLYPPDTGLPTGALSPLDSTPAVPDATDALPSAPALDGEAVGRLVTRTVNDEIGRAARRRRYTG